MTWVFMMGAWASDAEGERIAEDLAGAVRERQWRAVERKYRQLVERHPTVLTAPIHAAAAEAARSRGDLLRVAQRLTRTGAEAAQDDLALLASNTGLVQIACEVPGKIEPAAFPFQPDFRAAIEGASVQLQSSGVYVGLLPVGQYTACARTFDVMPGFDWQVL